ncbi:glycogen debranching protein GlgX [Alteromonas sp. 14N.309.X.WAT.G.H12]|uniref:glycogen debranching protein GlgX n=1 Tax=Alteromonas sp. 14N.309.X.WAT.G.H12 TaxID=3120824 RepID=UPI002FD28C9B
MQQDFTNTWPLEKGLASPLGATLNAEGCNFAVYCPGATAVILCLYQSDTEEPLVELILTAKTGDIWHGFVPKIKEGQLYGYRVERNDGFMHISATDKLLIDPYAQKLSRPLHWNARQYENDSHFMIPKAVVVAKTGPCKDKRPKYQPHERIIYEAHVKGLTKLHPYVPEEDRGTYVGAAHEAVIEHLLSLGITSVQFMPIAAFMPEPYITEKGLTNYWGYNPVNFFAPEPRYAKADALAEVKAMVEAYHDAGLEVILDVVYNHTAEGGDGGPVLSFKGFCPQQAYLLEQAPSGKLVYSNHSGCGNTVNTAQPMMMTMIMDAMRHWVVDIGIDGFRFDLAVCLGRDPQHFSSQSGLIRAIGQDPVLKDVVLIAEPWDIGPGGYQLGAFPVPWLETSDRYRDTVRAYWRGDHAFTAEFATRLMGSTDIFHKGIRPITTSVNNITYHDGFTLHDLVSYAERHNEENGENNRDGHGHNLSANYGHEGETKDEGIIALREKQKRNMFVTLLLSQGTPHILGGDELSRTQQGNNNAYCQDNPISWFNWELNKRQTDFLHFCRYVIELRKKSGLLSHLQMEDDTFQLDINVSAIRWYKPDGQDKESEDWQSPNSQTFGVEIRGIAQDEGETEHWFMCFNASDQDRRFNLPSLSPKGAWQLIIDTRYGSLQEQPEICIQRVFLQAAKSVVVFKFTQCLT